MNCRPPILKTSGRLPPEEQQALAARAKAGDQRAFERLLASYQPMIWRESRRYLWSGLDHEELIAEASMGVARAVLRYDPKRARFSTHVWWWIRQAITKATFSLTDHRRLRGGRIEQHPARVSLDAKGDDDAAPLLGRMRAERDTEQEAIASESEQHAKSVICRFVATLTRDVEIEIVRRRLAAEEPATFDALGRQFQLSRERVRQIELKLLARLRAFACVPRSIPPTPVRRSRRAS